MRNEDPFVGIPEYKLKMGLMMAWAIVGVVKVRITQATDNLGQGCGRAPRYLNTFKAPLFAKVSPIVSLASAATVSPF